MLALTPENLKIRHEASYTEGQQNILEQVSKYIGRTCSVSFFSSQIALFVTVIFELMYQSSAVTAFGVLALVLFVVFAVMLDLSIRLDKAIAKRAQLYCQQLNYSVEVPTLDQLRDKFATMESDDGYE